MRKYDLTTKRTKDTKTYFSRFARNPFFSFVLFAIFVVKYPSRFRLRLCRGGLILLIAISIVLPFVLGSEH